MTRVYVEPELIARIADEADPNGLLAARYAAKARAATGRDQSGHQRYTPPAPAPRYPRHIMGSSGNSRLQQPSRPTTAHRVNQSRVQAAITLGCHAAKLAGIGIIAYILAGVAIDLSKYMDSLQ